MQIAGLTAGAILAIAAFVQGATASTIKQTISFSATNFIESGAPVDPVTGSFTLELDPTQSYSGSTQIVLNNLNIKFDGVLQFDFFAPGGIFTIGAGSDGANPESGNTNDFTLVVWDHPVALSPIFSYFQGSNDFFAARDVTYSITTTPLPEPLPDSALMLATAIGVLGGVTHMRRRRWVSNALPASV